MYINVVSASQLSVSRCIIDKLLETTLRDNVAKKYSIIKKKARTLMTAIWNPYFNIINRIHDTYLYVKPHYEHVFLNFIHLCAAPWIVRNFGTNLADIQVYSIS